MAIIKSEVIPTPESSDDVAFAQAFGFNPATADTIDLEKGPVMPDGFTPIPLPEAAPVFKNPNADVPERPDNTDRGSNSLMQERLRSSFIKSTPAETEDVNPDFKKIREQFVDIKTAPAGDVLSNENAVFAAPKYVVTQIGKLPYPVDYDDLEFDGVRIANVSGSLPYLGVDSFANGVAVKELTIPVAGKIYQAVQAKSITALIDAMAATVNVPYRYLTVADHYQIMYYHLITDYPPQSMPVTWRSMYGMDSTAVASTFNISESMFTMSPEEWTTYADKGFTLPRVYDLESAEHVADIEGGDYIMKMVRWLDPRHAKITPYVKKAAERKSASPRLQGRIDFLSDQKVRFSAELEAFKQRVSECGFSLTPEGAVGTTETVLLTVNKNEIDLATALDRLSAMTAPAQTAEYDRLKTMCSLEIDKIDAQRARMESAGNDPKEIEAEILRLSNALMEMKFGPVQEEVPLIRNQWSFFPFI